MEVVENETEIPNERYISPEERQQVIGDLRLIWYDNGISKKNKFAVQYTKSSI